MKKLLKLYILFFVQFCYGQDSNFSFRVNSITDFYDSQTFIYTRRYAGNEISFKLALTNEELLLINDFFDKIKFNNFPDEFSCNRKISVFPRLSYEILLRKNGINKESINSNCVKNDIENEKKFEKLWVFIFSILDNKELVKSLKISDIELF